MLRLVLPVVFLFFFSGPVTAQGIIKGLITESGSGLPLPGVHVVSGQQGGTITDADGWYLFSLHGGKGTLTFSFLGYRSERRDYAIAAGDTLRLDITMMPVITTLNEIVVSAGKTEQRLSELTVSMNVVKPYIISRNHVFSADEMMNRTPGIEILDGQASVRGGSGYSYGAGSRVLALIDGLPAMSADAGNIKWHTLPMENISRIEVIKGASSVLYGSSALNGVINFITRDPLEESYTQVLMSSAVYDEPSRKEWKWWDSPRMTGAVSFSHAGIYKGTGMGIGLRLSENRSYRTLNDERYARLNMRLKRHGKKNERSEYGLNLNATMISKTDFLLWENANTGALKQNPATALPFRGTTLAIDPFLKMDRPGGGEHSITTRLLTNINKLPGNENNNSNSYSLYSEYRYNSGRKGAFATVAGVNDSFSFISSEFYGNHNSLNLAGYAQMDIYILNWLRGVAGFRIEEYIIDGNASRPIPIFRTGLNITLAENTFLRASAGQGYRYPAVAEKHAYTTVGSIKILPNNEIKPEAGWSAETGLKHGFSLGRISGHTDMALFYSQNKDLIEFVFGYWYDVKAEEFTYGFRPVNIENSRVYGAEAEVLLTYSQGRVSSTLSAGYTYMYPVEFNGTTGKNTGEYLKFRRKHSADINLTVGLGHFESGVNLDIRSPLLAIDDVFTNELTREEILPGFYDYWLEHNTAQCIADLFVSFRTSRGFVFSAGVKNLTNTEYMGRPGDIQPQRQFSLQISAMF